MSIFCFEHPLEAESGERQEAVGGERLKAMRRERLDVDPTEIDMFAPGLYADRPDDIIWNYLVMCVVHCSLCVAYPVVGKIDFAAGF